MRNSNFDTKINFHQFYLGYADTGAYWLNGYTVTDKEVLGYENNLMAINTADFQAQVEAVFNDVCNTIY